MALVTLPPVYVPAAYGAAVPAWVDGGLTDNPSNCTSLLNSTRERIAHHTLAPQLRLKSQLLPP